MNFPLPQRWFCVAVLFSLASFCSRPVFALYNGDAERKVINSRTPKVSFTETVVIPGPLPSFLRMAAVSQEVSAEDVIPFLARNVSLYGYQYGKPTEYLVLLARYVHFARELSALSGAEGTIRVTGCDDALRLIAILGYRAKGSCGHRGFALVTANAERAFLTIDSGFPLTTLERNLQNSEPFVYEFSASRVPIVFTEKEWVGLSSSKKQSGGDLLDMLLQDHDLDRLYWGLARCDADTRTALKQSLGLRRMLALVPAFELYGGEIQIHQGHVDVPANSVADWQTLVGKSPNSPGEFVAELLAKDHGWLAAYFDAFSHLDGTQQAHLAQNGRLERLYAAYKSGAPRTNAVSGVFPKDGDLLVFLTSVKWKENGEPDIPGDVSLWQNILSKRNTGDRRWTKRIYCCATSEQLLETLAADSHIEDENGPVGIFLTLSALDAGRPGGRKLSDGVEELIADKHAEFSRWFPVFADFPSLDDSSVVQFLGAADHVDAISNQTLRANALGAFQGVVGLWQILARQGEIPSDKMNSSWLGTVQPFAGVTNSIQLFDAARNSLQTLLLTATGKTNLSQDEIVDLLAGPSQETPDGKRVHTELSERIRSVMEDQRLVSLDTLFGLYDGLSAMAKGSDIGKSLLPLAGGLREFEMPRPIFTGNERSTWAPLVYTRRHAELQVRTDLVKIMQAPASPSALQAARGQLTPFLRDTLVGLNYAYYEPPGAEILHNNPLFVRSHDFSSISILGLPTIWGDSTLVGVGATAGGGAYFAGSLADLPYALAVTESDLIAPKHVQALIWQEAVPDLLVDAVLPRWWNLSRDELHAAALYQRAGEELFMAAVGNEPLRAKIFRILADRMTPNQLERVEAFLRGPMDKPSAESQLLPSEAFHLSAEFEKEYPSEFANLGDAAKELDALARKDPTDTKADRLAKDFGVPHPALFFANTCGLVNMKPPPAFSGNSSRLFAQAWESNNLYWARLADEMGYSPVMLNLLVPSLTRRMVVNIFASDIDDWPALLRAMRETGEEFRTGKISVAGVTTLAQNQ